ncbi:MAG: hypothetical protein CSA15_00325 [Candidatus Delongbacteria bacterium]|nr:MAG: hypothetical protein CSA15_00325 [Candidatus Delongbacteria bacterium]
MPTAKEIKEYAILNKMTPDGTYTVSGLYKNADMKALREYCTANKIAYEDLTDDELNKFGFEL